MSVSTDALKHTNTTQTITKM